MAHVFISYRHREPDHSLAETFARALTAAGHEVFIDTAIGWGTNWARRIRDELARTEFLLLLLSREAAASEMVTEELSIAREIGRCRVLALRVNLPLTEPLPYLLSAQLRQIQQQCWDGDSDTARLTDLLISITAGNATFVMEGSAPDLPFRYDGPAPLCDPRELPGGAISTDANYYVLRDADAKLVERLTFRRPIVTIRGPRQSGKTSLILRAHHGFRVHEDHRSAFVDLQALEGTHFQSLDALWSTIVEVIAYELDIAKWHRDSWNRSLVYNQNIDHFFDQVLGTGQTHLLVCLDEVDRLFSFNVKNDFFSSLRALYNKGARDATWARVGWVLGTSSEPSFFIEAAGSPFNVGLPIELAGFTEPQIADLGQRYGLSAKDADAGRIHAYLGGQPYLVHLTVTLLARHEISAAHLFDSHHAAHTVFSGHLMRFLLHFQRDHALADAMKRVVAGRGCRDARLADRLKAAGLARDDGHGKVVSASELYTSFFGMEL